MHPPLVEIKKFKKYFTHQGQIVQAVNGISFEIFPQETLGLIGESGCGKTTLGQTLMGLYKPTSGDIIFKGKNLLSYKGKDRKTIHTQIQYLFQDPYSSLNPRMTVEEIIAEPLQIHSLLSPSGRKNKVRELLGLVGLLPEHMGRFPHELSGGQRQRIGIARALILNPIFLICDEPVAALDVSIQAQIISLLQSLQKHMGLTYLFISHDLSIVKYLSDRVAVMYLGHLMELAPNEILYNSPLHPYTQALLSAIPIPNPTAEKARLPILLKGEIPSATSPPKGCPFCTRCPKAETICFEILPPFLPITASHSVACHLVLPKHPGNGSNSSHLLTTMSNPSKRNI